MSTDFTAFRALVRKDIAIFLRDRRALVVSVVTPIVIAAFFGFLFGGTGSGDVVSRLPVAMVDLDSSPLSKAVVDSLAQDPALAVKSLTEAEARQEVQSGKMRAAVVLPVGFGAAAPAALFGGGPKPAVDVYYDPSQSIVLPLVTGLLTQHVMDQVMRTLPSGQGMSVPFALTSVGVSTGPRYNSYAHSFAGMSVQFILFMGIDAGVALILMRKAGMWQRLRAAPLSRSVLLGSRVVGTMLIALTILAAVYTVAIAVFGVRIAGSVPGFILVAAAFALLAAATGLMIASVGRSEGATRGVAIFVVLLLVMLGGAWVPAFLFPQWLQRVSDFTPTRWAVDGLDAMTWRGLPLHAAFAPAAVVLGWAVLFGLIAVWRFDWEGE
jgi:ABC-2 type transport system permease protein